MKKLILFFILITSLQMHSECWITCSVRHMYQSNDSEYSDRNTWSKRSEMKVKFCSGQEANEQVGKQVFDPTYIIAHLYFNDGTVAVIILEKWKTNMKYIDEKEVIFNTTTNQRIYSVDGFDTNKRYWEIYF